MVAENSATAASLISKPFLAVRAYWPALIPDSIYDLKFLTNVRNQLAGLLSSAPTSAAPASSEEPASSPPKKYCSAKVKSGNKVRYRSGFSSGKIKGC